MRPSSDVGTDLLVPAPRRRRAVVVAAVLAAAAASSVLPGLGERSVSYDEGVSVAMARATWTSFTDALTAGEANMSLYYLVLRCVPAAGDEAALLRAPSAIAFVLAVPLVAVVGTRVIGRTGGLVAAVLVGTNSHVIAQAQTARSYAALLLAHLVSTAILLHGRALPTPRRTPWLLAWGLVSGATAYLHLVGVGMTIAQVLAFGLAWPRAVRSLLPGLAVAALLWLPLGSVAVGQGTAAISWIEVPSPAEAIGVLAEVLGGPPLLVLVVLAGVGVGLAGVREPVSRFLLGLAVLPVLGLYGVSLLGPASVFLPRYLIAMTPAAALLVAAQVTRVRPAVLAGPLAIGAVLLSVAGGAATTQAVEEDFRGAAAFVVLHARDGDVTAFVDPTALPAFELHAGGAAPRSVFPRTPTGGSLFDGRTGLGGIEGELPAAVARIRSRTRVWLVESHTSTPWAAGLAARFVEGLERAGHVATSSCTFRGVRVVLYGPRGAAAPAHDVECPSTPARP